MSIILNPARRRAERFAELLDEPGAAGADGPFAADLATVASMRTLVETAPAPRADFVADLRSRLMAEADTVLVPTDRRLLLPDRTGSGRRQGRAAAVIAAAALVAGSAGMAVAAQNSLPGESLYSLKRGIENTHEALSFSNAAQGKALLGQASARLGEAQSLTKRGNSAEASATLDKFVASAGSGADLLFRNYQAHQDVDNVTAVRDFAGTSMGDLDALSASAPASMRPSLVAAAQLLADLDQQARVLCAECGARSPLSAPSDLELASAPSLEQLLVDRSTVVPKASGTTKPGSDAAPTPPVQVPDVAGTLQGATGSPTGAGGSTPGSGGLPVKTPVKTPVKAPSVPSLPSTVGQVTDSVGQVVTGTVGAVTSTITGLTNLTGLTPTPPTP